MNILIVSQYFWPESFRINSLAETLVDRGHQVEVLTGNPNYPQGKFYKGYGYLKKVECYKGAKIVRVPIIPRGKNNKFMLALNYISYAVSASFFGLIYCRKKYDLILVFQMSPITMGLPAVLLKFFRKVPIFFWVQDLWPESVSAVMPVRNDFFLRILDPVVNLIYKNCDRILIQSRAFLPAIEKYGIDRTKILFFPNSAERLYTPKNPSDEFPEKFLVPKGFNIMFAGNIGIAQDFESIIEAAEITKENKEINWVIIGDGSRHSWIEEEISRRGLANSVYLLGRFPVERMPYFFSLADVMLVSLKDEYIFSLTIPSKVQSYMACSKPILASVKGEGARVVKESGSGLTCLPEDPTELATTVMKFYSMEKSELESMGKSGRSYFEENFEENMLLDKFEDWVRNFSYEFD